MTSPYTGYAISFLLGSLVLKTILRGQRLPAALFLFLAVATGLGWSAFLGFFSLLLCDGFHPAGLLAAHGLCIGALGLWNVRSGWETARKFRVRLPARLPLPMDWLYASCLIFLFALSSGITYAFAIPNCFGDWDGWAVWNTKMKFILTAGSQWENVFRLHWHTQPEYPLLLPLVNAWGWIFFPKNFYTVPVNTGILVTLCSIGLMHAGLTGRVSRWSALLAAAVLALFPQFTILGVSQYADVVLAFYLLAAVTVLLKALTARDEQFFLLAGLLIGFLTFTKNEGIIMAALLVGISGIHIGRSSGISRKLKIRMGLCLAGGCLLTSLPTIVLKTVLAPPNRDILVWGHSLTGTFFNWEGIVLVWRALFKILTATYYSYIFLALGLLFVLQAPRYFKKENAVLTVFLLCYTGILLLVYLTTINFDLEWRLSRTLGRQMLILLPVSLFLYFYACWPAVQDPEPNTPSADNHKD
ncbi:MAG: glycosyltransferase family 39 protein [Candidatus Omnitrophota bacterium]|nr:glycosyltransferase family 39 protein [Candidatus Omnitrophota bacterium]MDZ4243145.1 glycosyltransferase family 39 protein [Candidatus Omnitrophota bacterium]